jgi:hypothetical protein
MQEEVENRTVQFAIRTAKLSIEMMLKGMKTWHNLYQRMKQQKQYKKLYQKKDDHVHGKQSVKELIGQGDGVKSVPVTDEGIREFKKIAGKYGVDFAIVKDKQAENPQYTVFFKAKDEDAILSILRDYAAKRMKGKDKPDIERPSILEQLKALKEMISKMPHKIKDRWKEPER